MANHSLIWKARQGDWGYVGTSAPPGLPLDVEAHSPERSELCARSRTIPVRRHRRNIDLGR
jgi:hypothetical protein